MEFKKSYFARTLSFPEPPIPESLLPERLFSGWKPWFRGDDHCPNCGCRRIKEVEALKGELLGVRLECTACNAVGPFCVEQ